MASVSSPSPSARAKASSERAIWAVNTELLTSLAVCPGPDAPQMEESGRRTSSAPGRARSRPALSPPTSHEHRALRGRRSAATHGASSTVMSFSAPSRPRRIHVSGCTVECTSRMPPGAKPDSTPSGPSTTSTTSSSPVTQMQTIDDASAKSAGGGRRGRRVLKGLAGSQTPGPQRQRQARLDDPARHGRALASQPDEAHADSRRRHHTSSGRPTDVDAHPAAAARASAEAGACRNPAQPSSRSATCTAKGSTSRPCALARSARRRRAR